MTLRCQGECGRHRKSVRILAEADGAGEPSDTLEALSVTIGLRPAIASLGITQCQSQPPRIHV
jgi:hypothetical protein